MNKWLKWLWPCRKPKFTLDEEKKRIAEDTQVIIKWLDESGNVMRHQDGD